MREPLLLLLDSSPWTHATALRMPRLESSRQRESGGRRALLDWLRMKLVLSGDEVMKEGVVWGGRLGVCW